MALATVTIEDKYALGSGRVFLTGIQSLARLLIMQRQRDAAAGLNTAGFVSGYQGAPLNLVDQTMRQAQSHLKQNHIHFQAGQNEELAMMGVWGSQQVTLFQGARYDGVFSMWYGKWAGLGRCGDVLNHGNSAGAAPAGGVLLVCGDDHVAHSSTIATQSEYMLLAPMVPVLVPAGVQDYLDLGIHSWAMSRYSGSWVGFKALDETVESSASVYVDPQRIQVKLPGDFALPEGGLGIRLPDQPMQMERRIHDQRLPAVLAYARANGLNRIVADSPRARLGIVAAGKSYLDVRQALDHLGIDDRAAAEIGLRVYKIGLSWPLEPQGLRQFAQGLEEILVVEEKRALIEDQIKDQLYHWPSERRPRVLGKRDDSDESGAWLLAPNGELTPERIADVIAGRIARFHRSESIEKRAAWLREKEEALAKPALSEQLRGYLFDAGRVPFFCSGCPHNTSTRVPEGSTAIAGVGCHFMATYIFSGTKIFSPMGAEGAVWVGHAPFTDARHIFANMGDGTYHHSGLLAIRAAVTANVDLTVKILYNDATAATGGQPLPGQLNVPAITRQLDAEGVKRIVVVTDQPEKYARGARFAPNVSIRHRDQLEAVQRELREQHGVTAIVYDQTCAAEKRRRRKRGAFPDPARRAFINSLVCEGCGDCSVKANCVSIAPVETEFGRKRAIDQSSCNKDYSCIRGFCPSYITVEGGALRKSNALAVIDDAGLPEPQRPALDRPFGIVVAGVGGTGVITIGALLGMGAHLEGKGVSVLDMTGVAQKGGAVVTFVRIGAAPEALHSVRIAAGDANAVIGCDIVVGVENAILSKMRRGFTRAVFNTNRFATVAFIRNPDLQTPYSAMEQGVRDTVGEDAVRFVNATRLATALMGESIGANVFMLGFAWQTGLIPLSAEALLRAIELNGVEVEANRRAFMWGRLAAHDPARVEHVAEPADSAGAADRVISGNLDQVIERRVEYLTRYQDAAYAARYRNLVERARKSESAAVGSGNALTDAIARSYFNLLANKDEYEVARLHTEGDFLRQVDAAFEGDYSVRFHFAPPLWARPDPVTGEPVKRAYGPWVLPLLRVLARLNGLRGTMLDPFGYSAERRTERRLPAEYERIVDELLSGLTEEKLALATEIASLPLSMRGFGHVKHENIEVAKQREAELMARFRAPARPPLALAA
ncbi:MAG: indolepyruvate ferredoxin oxidoreductase family protein [Betaproteobacteria bacterium]|nr:indolepyruvate ferredoxin oxidoreductase family protein [Betaproteobacteria bacterium]